MYMIHDVCGWLRCYERDCGLDDGGLLLKRLFGFLRYCDNSFLCDWRKEWYYLAALEWIMG